jgi:hypothetical protein
MSGFCGLLIVSWRRLVLPEQCGNGAKGYEAAVSMGAAPQVVRMVCMVSVAAAAQAGLWRTDRPGAFLGSRGEIPVQRTFPQGESGLVWESPKVGVAEHRISIRVNLWESL